jgi:hypothetical protein
MPSLRSSAEGCALVGIDLFCGVGELSLGFEQAGVEVAGAFDLDTLNVAAHSCQHLRLAGSSARDHAILSPQGTCRVRPSPVRVDGHMSDARSLCRHPRPSRLQRTTHSHGESCLQLLKDR